MSDYCHRKVIRMKISEEEACKIFGIEMHPDARLDIEELLEAPDYFDESTYHDDFYDEV